MDRMEDVPWPLQEAINHGLGILSWYENYVEDEIPNPNLWDDGEAIEEHFKRLRLKKEEERDGWGTKQESTNDESSDLMGNDLASVFKQQ